MIGYKRRSPNPALTHHMYYAANCGTPKPTIPLNDLPPTNTYLGDSNFPVVFLQLRTYHHNCKRADHSC